MEGLKYILSEIEARQYLLHGFMKGMETSKEFALFSGDVPDFVKDGEVIYRPNTEDEPYRNLTVEDFNSLYKEKFMDLQEWSRLLIPLNPSKPQPANYEFNELLVYEFGGGYCQASIYMWLINPYLRQQNQRFYLFAECRSAPRPPIKYIKNGQEWTCPRGFKIHDSDLEKLLMQAHPYARWKKDARKASPRLKGVNDRKDIGGAAIAHEGNKIFTVPIIVIEEDTTREQIWGQLLIYAWGSGYFKRNSPEENDAYSELRKYLLPKKYRNLPEDEVPDYVNDKIHRILEYFWSHTFSPYNVESSDNYLRKLLKTTTKKIKYERSEGMKRSSKMIADIGLADNTEDYEIQYPSPEEPREDDYSIHYFSYPPGSIPDVARQTGVREWTIYRLIRQGKIKATRNEEGFILLDNDAIRELKQLATLKEKRKDISQLAEMKGKSREAIKKWLQRHRDLPEDKFNKELSLWLEVRQP